MYGIAYECSPDTSKLPLGRGRCFIEWACLGFLPHGAESSAARANISGWRTLQFVESRKLCRLSFFLWPAIPGSPLSRWVRRIPHQPHLLPRMHEVLQRGHALSRCDS